MSTSTILTHPAHKDVARRQRSPAVLAAFLLSDAVTDVELVSREPSLSPAMLDRMHRALDGLRCVSAILETAMSVQFAGGGELRAFTQLREYLDEWPDDGLAMLVADDFLESGRDASQCDSNVAPT